MKKTITLALVSVGLLAVGCVDHSEDFQSTTPDLTPASAAAAPQAVTPATTLPSTMAPPTTAPAANP